MAAMRFQNPNETVLLQLMTVIGSRINKGVMLEKLRDKWPGDSMKPPSLKDTDVGHQKRNQPPNLEMINALKDSYSGNLFTDPSPHRSESRGR